MTRGLQRGPFGTASLGQPPDPTQQLISPGACNSMISLELPRDRRVRWIFRIFEKADIHNANLNFCFRPTAAIPGRL